MNANTARYMVERRRTHRSPWCPVARCHSLDYARIIAGVGVRRHYGVAYRVMDAETGQGIAVAPEVAAQAA